MKGLIYAFDFAKKQSNQRVNIFEIVKITGQSYPILCLMQNCKISRNFIHITENVWFLLLKSISVFNYDIPLNAQI